ncbi:hypothetical protein KB553_09885 [Chryseobacterium rhizoplanae]|uniref:hypothetical protein n=1 Tax=Chryseobacterium rhizoplanae TaxID=1609531 RepID=UPI001CE28322|nr:hypothetical protein [Chryseobacterium rhizoplanae]UCA61814.1 hypothetical protein KB553_09885 [Chryseobacterium rhizoplanae]
MKKLSLLFLMLTIYLHAQTLELVNGDYTFFKTIRTPKKKKEIYPILKKWLADNSMEYVITQDDPDSGILAFDERLSLVHYNDTESTFPSFTNTLTIKNRQVVYNAGHIIFQDHYGGMTNIRNDYRNLVSRITTSTGHISELKDQLSKETDVKKRLGITKEIMVEQEKLNQLGIINKKLTDRFSRNIDMIARMLGGEAIQR